MEADEPDTLIARLQQYNRRKTACASEKDLDQETPERSGIWTRVSRREATWMRVSKLRVYIMRYFHDTAYTRQHQH